MKKEIVFIDEETMARDEQEITVKQETYCEISEEINGCRLL